MKAMSPAQLVIAKDAAPSGRKVAYVGNTESTAAVPAARPSPAHGSAAAAWSRPAVASRRGNVADLRPGPQGTKLPRAGELGLQDVGEVAGVAPGRAVHRVGSRVTVSLTKVLSGERSDEAMNRHSGASNGGAIRPVMIIVVAHRAAEEIADKRGLTWHVGGIASTDVFYHPSGLTAYDALHAHDVLAVEMEAAALYTLAARYGTRAVAIRAISDNIVTGDKLALEERQSSLTDMVELSLDVAVGA